MDDPRAALKWRVKAGNRSKFRFSIRNLLLATFWLSLWGADVVIYRRVIETPGLPPLLVLLPMWMFLIAGPFVVVGSVFNRTRTGFVVGVSLALMMLLGIVLLFNLG